MALVSSAQVALPWCPSRKRRLAATVSRAQIAFARCPKIEKEVRLGASVFSAHAALARPVATAQREKEVSSLGFLPIKEKEASCLALLLAVRDKGGYPAPIASEVFFSPLKAKVGRAAHRRPHFPASAAAERSTQSIRTVRGTLCRTQAKLGPARAARAGRPLRKP